MSINEPLRPSSHPSQSSAAPPLPLHVPQIGYNARLPDFCNLGVILRLLVIVNMLVLGAAMARADIAVNASDLMREFLTISIVAQPAIILSLVATCAAKSVFMNLSYWRGISAVFVLESLIGVLFW